MLMPHCRLGAMPFVLLTVKTHPVDVPLQDCSEPGAAPTPRARAARPTRKAAVKPESDQDEPMTDKEEDEAASGSDDDFAAPTTGKRKVPHSVAVLVAPSTCCTSAADSMCL